MQTFWLRAEHGLMPIAGKNNDDIHESALAQYYCCQGWLFVAFKRDALPAAKPPACLCVLSRFRPVRLFATPWTVAHQASLSMGSSWQDYWSGLPCSLPGDLPDPGPVSLTSPALAGKFFTTRATWEAHPMHRHKTLHFLWFTLKNDYTLAENFRRRQILETEPKQRKREKPEEDA